MKNKIVIILVFGFLSKVFISCCNCDDTSSTYENFYTDVVVIPYDNSGFYPQIVTDTVHKNAFGIEIIANYDLKTVNNNIKSISGFNSALAFSCNCFDESNIFNDSISCIKVHMIGISDKSKIEVTDFFKMRDNNNKLVSINEYFSKEYYWNHSFQLKMEEYSSILNSTIFEVEVFLKSNNSFKAKTDIIHFFD